MTGGRTLFGVYTVDFRENVLNCQVCSLVQWLLESFAVSNPTFIILGVDYGASMP